MLTIEHSRRTGPFPMLRDGLVVALPFAADRHPASPRELVSGARPNTFAATSFKDEFGNPALRWNGTSDQVKYDDGPGMRSPSTQITVYCRIRLPSTPVAGSPPFGKLWGANVWYSYGLEIDQTQTNFYLQTGANVACGDVVPPLNKWVSIFGRWRSGGNIYLEGYLDGGQLVMDNQTAAVTGTLAYDAGQLYLGTTPAGTRLAMDMAAFAVWNRFLSEGEMFLLVTDPQVLFRRTLLTGPFTAGHLSMFGQLVDQNLSPASGAVQSIEVSAPADRGATLTVTRAGTPTEVPLTAGASDTVAVNSTDPQDPEYIRYEPDPGS